MSGRTIRQRLLASTTVAGAVLLAMPAFAQTTQEAPTAPAADNPAPSTPAPVSSDGSDTSGGADIIVTGSRIPRPELESASPVTFIGAAEVKQTGTTRVEDLLNQLPQVFADQGSNISNGATGTATVSLRGLGASRTLVLVNGRRIVPGDPASNDSAADVNLIPSSLIKRVDVLTGGASSVYGADAVSGVVNFVLDTEFSGLKLDGQYSVYNHDNRAGSNITDPLNDKNYGYPRGYNTNGGTYDLTAVMGAGFDDDHGHVTAYVSYRNVKPVLEGSRDYSSCSLAALAGGGYSCGGSPTGFPTNFYKISNGQYYQQVGGQFNLGPVDADHPNGGGPLLYNFAPTNYFQRPDERYTAGFFAHYDVSDAIKPYMEFMFMDDVSTAQVAASGDFFNTNTINCDNPFLTAQQLTTLCSADNVTVGADGVTRAGVYIGRRNVEGGGRQDVLTHTTYRAVVGSKGDLAKGVSYDAYYQYGRVTSSDIQQNQLSISKLTNALDAVAGPNGPVCRSGGACVPYNIFTDGGVTQAALNYIGIPTFSAGRNTEQVVNASLTFQGSEYGFASPLASEGLGLNFGGEYRKETNTQNYDTSFSSGDIAGAGSAPQPISGAFDVKEAFVEASLPLVQDKPFFELLTINGGYRYSHYEIANTTSKFNTKTYKGEVIWRPIRDIQFRGSYNRAVRAPNIGELFLAQQVVLDGSTDPCAGNAVGGLVNGFTAAQCALTGVTAAQFGNIAANGAQQYNGFVGGNPNLKPETSDSYTAGIVLTPTFLRGFSATVDYFNIKVKDNIGIIGADTIINQCLKTGDAALCNLINRDALGSLFRTNQGFIVDTTLNQGSVKTSGIDVTLGYTQDLGNFGKLGLSGVGTYLDELISSPLPGVSFNCASFFGRQCGTPNPTWRHRARVTYTAPFGPSLSLQWRYFSKVRDDALSSDADLASPVNGAGVPTDSGTFPGNARIPAYNYYDLAFTVPVADKFTFRIGANNLLDKTPPVNALAIGVVQNGNVFAQVYDSLGRYIYAGVTLDL